MNERERQELERLKEVERKQQRRTKQQNDYIKKTYDRISITLPKGTKDQITSRGETINGLLNKLVLEWLEKN